MHPISSRARGAHNKVEAPKSSPRCKAGTYARHAGARRLPRPRHDTVIQFSCRRAILESARPVPRTIREPGRDVRHPRPLTAGLAPAGVQRTNSDAESLVGMTHLILKAIDFGASAVFIALCTKAFCVYLFKQPSARPVQSTSDHPHPPSSY